MYGDDNNEMFPYYYSTDFPSQFQSFDHINLPSSFPTHVISTPPPFSIQVSELVPFPALRSEFSHSSSSSQYGSSPSSLPTTPLRRNVFSTCDLQGMNDVVQYHSNRWENPLQHDISIIGGMNKACKYSPEEKKDKIERYKSKRNQRNFNKKIKYECRKTLADNRQRIRGRFARNDETDDKINYPNHQVVEEEEDDKWISFLMHQYQQM